MKYCRKAINFDLRISDLKLYFNKENPNYAYTLIENYMIEHKFIHRQYSGYVSNDEMSDNQLISFSIKMSKDLPWLHKCLTKCDSTDISNLHDLIQYFELPFKNYDSRDVSLLCDTSNEYKLYLDMNGIFTLYDEFDDEIGSTECDNIDDALEELQEQSDLSI